ncbi:MAG: MFS transporter [Desulfobacula sp.]|nr:MFS transporter [Desulfobacula sp.]
MPVIKDKRIILALGCLALFFPGSFVFGFPGVMAGYWQEIFAVNKAQIGRLMFFILAGTGFSMYLAGKLQEKIAFNKMIFIGTLICGLAMILVGQANSINHIYLWGFLEGFFTGFVYIPCLTFFQKLYPEKKGLITGILNLTFGGSAAIMSPIYTYFLVSRGYWFTSNMAALLCIVFATSLTLLIKNPDSVKGRDQTYLSTLTLSRTLSMPAFWFLWLVWAFSGAAGVSLIVLSASFGKHLGYGITQYVYILTCFNVLNGIGRLVCGRLSDTVSKQKILMVVFLMAGTAYSFMAFSTSLFWVSFLACFIGLAFGGLFTVSAPLVTEVFGLENFGKVFGLIFTAYGFLAGALGPWLSGVILDATQSDFKMVFGMFALFYLAASIFILQVKKS